MGRKRAFKRRGPTRGKPKEHLRGNIEMNPRGFGFVKTSAGEFFIPKRQTNGAFDGDLVEIARMRSQQRGHGRQDSAEAGRRSEARVTNVVERAHESLIGRYEVAEPFGMVIPLDPRIPHDIFTERRLTPDIPDGSIVRVRITEYPTRRTAACGVIEEVIGDAGDTSCLIEQVMATHGIATAFPAEALAQAEETDTGIEEALRDGYADIRDRFLMTIDPSDARDFDDAISAEALADDPDGAAYRLGVHIADVSRYVQLGSPLDLEARSRTCSVYLPDRVVPMLPERLSNGICSLVPGEDRLCMTADLYLDAQMRLLRADIYPAVMCSRARLSYDEALAMLEEGIVPDALKAQDEKAAFDALRIADAVASARAKARLATGGLEFSTREAKVQLDSAGEPIGVQVRTKTRATELIEECMIFANEAVAMHLSDAVYPCAYRVHEPPPADAIAGLIPGLQEFKWFTRDMGRKLAVADPYAYQEALESCKGRLEETLVSTLLLRTMSRAVYSLDNIGHYGLGLDEYCHFTSPIRRYPDLMVHRMVKLAALGHAHEAAGMKDMMRTSCSECSQKEREAEAASSEATRAMMCIYMASFIGQRFTGVISGVASHGLYVELDMCAEGLVPVRDLGHEYFAFDPIRMTLTGTDSSKVYRLGDAIEVKLTEADPIMRRLTFQPA